MTELCRCKLCGGEAVVSPATEEEYAERGGDGGVLISCVDCGAVDVWALAHRERTFDYEKLRAVAEERWNKLMGGSDEA